ncbi:SPFH domain-containing protein [Streptomyces sp. NPDC048659]|uniref:SPFH domain-containing protein n=1 Tax=Streptomyces sp. NPDC048659 TaxID=3155489 RepID=UPI0034499712
MAPTTPAGPATPQVPPAGTAPTTPAARAPQPLAAPTDAPASAPRATPVASSGLTTPPALASQPAPADAPGRPPHAAPAPRATQPVPADTPARPPHAAPAPRATPVAPVGLTAPTAPTPPAAPAAPAPPADPTPTPAQPRSEGEGDGKATPATPAPPASPTPTPAQPRSEGEGEGEGKPTPAQPRSDGEGDGKATPATPPPPVRLDRTSLRNPRQAPGGAPAGKPPAPDTGVDFGWIAGAQVKGIAVPVAASPAVAPRPPVTRRRNVIGAETTGSIPVHLLFREEADGADDGGPATVPVPKPKAPAHKPAPRGAAAVPAPARTPARPAPTADPQLVERPGPVLPGWVGVAGGALALAGCAALVWWTGAVPEEAARMLRLPSRPYHGIHLGQWGLLALGVLLTLFFLGGLGRGRVGYALVLTLFGDYRGTVRRTGLLWVSPLLLRRRVDVRLRHWRSEPLPAVDAKGTALDVVVLVVWRIRDTVRAALGVARHEEYLREQVEAAMARVLSQLPADAFHEDAPTLRDAEAVGEALTRMLSAECAPVGIDVFSAQPTRIEYAPEVAAAMRRRRIAAIDAKHRDSVLTSVVDAVDDVVHRLTSRGLVELDDYERKALVKDLTVAFYTGRTGAGEGA